MVMLGEGGREEVALGYMNKMQCINLQDPFPFPKLYLWCEASYQLYMYILIY